MVFNSVDYLLFFPMIAVLNCIVPKKYRYVLLCVASLLFYYISDAGSLPVIFGEAIFVYVIGMLLDYMSRGNYVIPLSKITTAVAVCFLAGTLIAYKYFLNVGYPLGMSFFTLMAIAYVIDVYRKKSFTEKNPLKMLLYITFFPIVASGPIERTGNLLKQIDEGVNVDVDKIKKGLLEIAWGLFMKLVVANRIAPMTAKIFEGYEGYRGIEIIIATILFGFQIYCDFAGYSYMAIGSARILGFKLIDNFDAPYMSSSVPEFWRRWHMSLYGWLREYIYFPLGGSRVGTIRKYANVMAVFVVSGMWHGEKLGFIFWGALNGIYVVASDMIKRISKKAGADKAKPDGPDKAKPEKVNPVKRFFGIILTFALVDYAWLFFKADSLKQGLLMSRTIITDPGIGAIPLQEFIKEFGEISDIVIVLAGIAIIIAFDVIKNRFKDVTALVFSKPLILRWCVYLVMVSLIIIFGLYGYSYEQTEFIYFGF